MRYLCAALLIVVAIALLWIYVQVARREHFASRQEKAQRVYDWFMTHPSPTYRAFRTDLHGESNIVEYEDVLQRSHAPNFTVASVASIV